LHQRRQFGYNYCCDESSRGNASYLKEKVLVWKNFFERGRRDTVRGRKAFTLVELLVVIGLIALLMAVLVSTLEQTRRQARAVKCRSNLNQWGWLFCSLAEENDGVFPGELGCRSSPFSYYVDNFEYPLFCPMAKTPREDRNWPGSTFYGWRCPVHPFRSGSYGVNNWAPFLTTDYSEFPDSWENTYHKGTADIPVLLDCAVGKSNPDDTDQPPPMEEYWLGPNMSGFCIDRHDGGINVLFMDASVRKVGLKELWTLKWHQGFNTANKWTSAGGVQPSDWPKWMRKFKDY
jgi:prepilin-type N-terminal cleavage/methylation domain-containing protein/prepilin-type processing-associated H-X9-DG protein